MSFALFINSVGNLEQINVGDTLNVDNIDVAGTGNMTIGASLGASDELQLGSSGGTSGTGDVRVLTDLYVDNDLYVTGSSAITVDETVTGTFNAEGDVNLGTGNGDTITIGGGGTDVVDLDGATVNLNVNLTVGDSAVSIGSGADDALAGLWLQTINTAGTGVDLRGTGNGTSGSEAIGVYTGGLTISPATDDLQTVIEALDAAIGSGGATLQTAYESGNAISVSTTYGAVQISNTTDATNVLELSRTFAGAGSALTVSMGASTTGIGVDIDSVAGASGNLVDILNAGDGVGLFLNNTGGGNAVQIQDGSTDVFIISQTGAISMTAQQASTFSTAAGNLTLDAIAGELVFDDVGNSGLTLSQASDRTLDTTGVLSGATSIIGSLNNLADEIDNVGVDQFVTVNLATGVTTTVGSPLAFNASGEVQLADADSAGNPQKFAGIAREADTGPVAITMWTPGARCTDAGAAHTPGDPLSISATAGDLTSTAPTGTGTLVQRVGWALTATDFILDPGPPVIL